MDDTLFLERSYVESGFRAVNSLLENAYGRSSFFEEFWRLFQTGRRGDIFNVARDFEGKGLSPELIKECIAVYREHIPNIELLSDSVEFIDFCRGAVRTALITDGPRVSQRAKILSLGLEGVMDTIVVTDEHDANWHKPEPKAFLSLEEEFGVSGEQCVYIGDNPHKDFVSPLRLGWKAIRVRRMGGLHEFHDYDGANMVVVPDLGKRTITELNL